MHPARQLAYQFILPRIIGKNLNVLDLGAGDAPLAGLLVNKSCDVVAVDKNEDRLFRAMRSYRGIYPMRAYDLSLYPWAFCLPEYFDFVTAVYSLQHFIGFEAAAWCEIQRVLKPGGKLLCCGRHDINGPSIEHNRQDPLRSDNMVSLETLALASGLELKEIAYYRYSESDYASAGISAVEANAYCAVVEKAC